ncbi:tetratricopeptide repeat protein [Rosettibacter firmus]|uniref:tetratricopeptide repeat protein n=1 Tax=Rosettibacter firmus TaxID=3111522 RepID=UPI00336BFBB3
MLRYNIFISFLFFAYFNLNAQDALSDAQKLIEKKQYEEAFLIAKNLLNKDSANTALKILIQLQYANYINKDVYENLGDAYSKLNINELALTNYEKAEAIDSLNVQLKFKIAELFYKEKRFKEAINKYLKIILIEPKNAKAYLAVATIFYQAKFYTDAFIMFEKYLSLEKSLDAYQKIITALLEIKNYEKAYNYALQALNYYPNDDAIKKNLALASYALKKYDESAKYYMSLPDSLMRIDDYENAARSLAQIKQDSLAIRYFEKVIELDSTRSNVYLELANVSFRNHNYSQAVKYYKAITNYDEKNEFAYRFLGFSYYQLKDYEEARKTLLKASALNDTIVNTYFYLAQTYKNLDSLNQAVEQYKKVIMLANDKEKMYKDQLLEANYFIGQRAFLNKNYAVAIQYLQKVLEFKPNDVGTLEMLGLSYHQLGKIENAIRIYKRVKQLNPNSEVAKKGLRMLSAD